MNPRARAGGRWRLPVGTAAVVVAFLALAGTSATAQSSRWVSSGSRSTTVTLPAPLSTNDRRPTLLVTRAGDGVALVARVERRRRAYLLVTRLDARGRVTRQTSVRFEGELVEAGATRAGRPVIVAEDLPGFGPRETLVVRLTRSGVLDRTFGRAGEARLVLDQPTQSAAVGPGGAVKLLSHSMTLRRLTVSGELDLAYGQGGRVAFPDDTLTPFARALAVSPAGEALAFGTGYREGAQLAAPLTVSVDASGRRVRALGSDESPQSSVQQALARRSGAIVTIGEESPASAFPDGRDRRGVVTQRVPSGGLDRRLRGAGWLASRRLYNPVPRLLELPNRTLLGMTDGQDRRTRRAVVTFTPIHGGRSVRRVLPFAHRSADPLVDTRGRVLVVGSDARRGASKVTVARTRP